MCNIQQLIIHSLRPFSCSRLPSKNSVDFYKEKKKIKHIHQRDIHTAKSSRKTMSIPRMQNVVFKGSTHCLKCVKWSVQARLISGAKALFTSYYQTQITFTLYTIIINLHLHLKCF